MRSQLRTCLEPFVVMTLVESEQDRHNSACTK